MREVKINSPARQWGAKTGFCKWAFTLIELLVSSSMSSAAAMCRYGIACSETGCIPVIRQR